MSCNAIGGVPPFPSDFENRLFGGIPWFFFGIYVYGDDGGVLRKNFMDWMEKSQREVLSSFFSDIFYFIF